MSDTTYRWDHALGRALRKNKRNAHDRWLQLATVRPDGTPAVRTLVFRALDDDASIRMITDGRSEKPAQIAANPAGEICWYFSQSREQFRLGGLLELVGPDSSDADEADARRRIWNGLSDGARRQLHWPHPGAALSAPSNDAPIDVSEPPAHFLLLTLGVRHVDHLTLRGDPQTRWISECDASGAWRARPVNP